MNAHTHAREEQDLERLYAQARHHDLLSREQEQEIDGRKWTAIGQLLELLCEDPFSRQCLLRWIVACKEPLPEIAQFSCREHRFLLRRELADYLPGGSQANKISALARQFARPPSQETLLGSLLELSLPATLVVGMAAAVSQRPAKPHGNKVAAALLDWQRQKSPQPDAADEPAPATQKALAVQLREYTVARDLLITHNLRLVYTIANRSRNKGAPFLDLVQEGNLGLLRAAEKFQFERGYRFSTYAFNWITQGIRRHLAESAGAIRFPSHIQEQLGKIHGERGRSLARSGTVMRDTELAGVLGLPVAKTRELLQLRNFALSLETPRFEEEPGTTLLDTMPGGPFADPAAEAEQSSLNRRLLSEIGQLTPTEQRVVIQRWGLLDEPPLTRSEIADQLSLSTERVRQLEQSGLKKLGQSETVHAVYSDHCHAPRQDHPSSTTS